MIICLDSLSGIIPRKKITLERYPSRTKKINFKYIKPGINKPHRVIKKKNRMKLLAFCAAMENLSRIKRR